MAGNYQQLTGQNLPLGHRPLLPRPIPAKTCLAPRDLLQPPADWAEVRKQGPESWKLKA